MKGYEDKTKQICMRIDFGNKDMHIFRNKKYTSNHDNFISFICFIIKQLMGPGEEEDNEEGFFPNIPHIIQIPNTSQKKGNQRPFDYLPRVTVRSTIDKKMPKQVLEQFNQVPVMQSQEYFVQLSPKRHSSMQQQQVSAYKMYESRSFTMIYSKTGKNPFYQAQDNFAKREVDLFFLSKYQQKNFKLLNSYQQDSLFKINQANNVGCLEFDSNFQCGNLLCSYQSVNQPNSYDCFIQNDTNTFGFNQWFYFSLKGMKKGELYQFNIVNMKKKFSFCKMGMKPAIFSMKRHLKIGNGWYRRAHNVQYKPSLIYDTKNNSKTKLYTLTFSLDFEYSEDFVTISLGVPYSYSKLTKCLKQYREIALQKQIHWQQKTIGFTLGNNQVPYIIVTNQHQQKAKTLRKKEESQDKTTNKKVIILLARQHPGQTNSSFIMESILRLLCKNDNVKINWLLDKFQFRIFPMVNVDGVIYGNFRCDLGGFDLNRCWKRPIKQLNPQIYAIKQEIRRLKKAYKVVYCIDIHSHSKQFNIFSYCCKENDIQSRLFSLILSKNSPIFHFPSCTFGISQGKQSTARAVISSIIKSQNVITIESSYYGSKINNQYRYFDQKSFKQFAKAILMTFKSYFHHDRLRSNCLKQIEIDLQKYKEYERQNWEELSGSDSQPDADIEDLHKKMRRIVPSSLFERINRQLNAVEIQEEIVVKQIRRQQIKPKSLSMPTEPTLKKQQKIRMKQKKPVVVQSDLNIFSNRKVSSMTRRNLDKQVVIQEPPYAWRQNWIKQKKVKTQPRQIINTSKQQQIDYQNKNRGDVFDDQEFKRSMKMIYDELRSSRKVQNFSSITVDERNIYINANNRFNCEKRINQFKNLSKLQKILKVKRKASIFKNIYEKIQPRGDDSTLMQIRSQMRSVDRSIYADKQLKQRRKMSEESYQMSTEYKSNYNFPFLNKVFKLGVKDSVRVN